MAESKVPPKLRAGILAVLLLGGGAAYQIADRDTSEMLRSQYIQAVAQDTETSQAVKLAMVMAAFYESSYKHIGKPYVDKLGKGEPLTVCNGITTAVAAIDANRFYTPAECYALEKSKFLKSEVFLKKDLKNWQTFTPLQQATLLDFLLNKGPGNYNTSTLRRKTLAGDIVGACRENVKWNRGTIAGASVVLPGLDTRGKSNAELCEKGLV